MKPRDAADLLALGALWGGSFLFMRLGAAQFGPWALVFVRVAGASALLLPLLAWRGEWPALRQHWRAIALVGVLNSAAPFVLFSIAALVLGAALMAVFNATAPIWGAVIAWAWLGQRLTPLRVAGLLLGLAGVAALAWGKADINADTASGISATAAMAACTGAALLYGLAANVSRRCLQGVPPLAVAAGSQLSATALLAAPALLWWPAHNPSPTAWAAAAVLALACTGLAYVLYFRLIANAGATTAIAVTFLVPGFAIIWGWLFLAELPSPLMVGAAAAILAGTGLATGIVGRREPAARRAVPPR